MTSYGGGSRGLGVSVRMPRAVLVAAGCALALHALWWWLLAGSGGDLAAQDAWAGFTLAHPTSAYDFAWYGGIHPASYSLLSPYLMGAVGVRTTMLAVGTLSAALLAVLVGHLSTVADPVWASVYGAVALTGNAVSGRVTFGVGILFGLAALAALFAWRPPRGHVAWWWCRVGVVVMLAGLATAASPVAGLFLGLVAAALWVRGRPLASLAVGGAPLVIVIATAALFPDLGEQPISARTAALPLVLAVTGWVLLPRGWRLGRVCSLVYLASVLVVWAVPSPIGTNIARMSLIFGGVALVAAASGRWWTSAVSQWFGRGVGRALLVAAILTASGWQLVTATLDAQRAATASRLDLDVRPVVAELGRRGASLGRVEVVPTRSHREASALAPYVNLARGWNRQADVARNPLFYREDKPLTAGEYRRWLDHWAVHFVVLPAVPVDYAGQQEADLVRAGVPFLRRVWTDPAWTLYEVVDRTPLATAPASVLASNAGGLTVRMPRAGATMLRIAWSPWLSIVDSAGRRLGEESLDGACLRPAAAVRTDAVSWVLLRVTRPGTYRIGAPYAVPRGTACPHG